MKSLYSIFILVLLSICFSFFTTGCFNDTGSDDDSGSQDGTETLSIVSIVPSDGSTDVAVNTDIIIQFNQSLDTAPGTVELGPITFTNGSNCTITFSTTMHSNDTVTVNPDSVLSYDTAYENVLVSGFKDSQGKSLNDCSDSDYGFHTVSACFVAGTLISTPYGPVPVEQISVGDVVYAMDIDSDEVVEKSVLQLYGRVAQEVFVLNSGGQSIRVTSEHPFYVKDMEWVRVKDLAPDDLLRKKNGQFVPIESISIETGSRNVYNFEVEDLHNYFVSESEFLVHNVK